ncbi:GerAB/ArcD/ProY family transporter [Neobacillus niacini]|uniref:GerAB/ArcD/ProY family transporter n=1 Tax=Neobacillus niacini TaxID=86668 RepID=UPI00398367B3
MNRYFLYLVFLNMLSNVIIFVPKFLIQYRYDGALLSIVIAIISGMILMYLDSIVFARFPGEGLPEIIENRMRMPFKFILLGGFSIFWFTAGLITLLGYIDILHRFINPDLPKIFLMVVFLAAICFVIQLPTQKVVYLLEIVLILNGPLIIFIFFKAITSDYLNWDSIFEVGTHLFTLPKLTPIVVASYVFSGYTNIIIFNRLFKKKIKSINFAVILVVSILNLVTSFLIPIGFHGADGAQEYMYPWIMTADSIRLVYSPIERALFIFLMLYISITLLSVTVHWHVAFELIKGCYIKNTSKQKNWLVLAYFIGFSILAVLRFDLMNPELIIKFWLTARYFFEIIVVFSFFFFLRRRNP